MASIKTLHSLIEVSEPQVKKNFIGMKLSLSALCQHEVSTAVICTVQVLETKRRSHVQVLFLDIKFALNFSFFILHF